MSKAAHWAAEPGMITKGGCNECACAKPLQFHCCLERGAAEPGCSRARTALVLSCAVFRGL